MNGFKPTHVVCKGALKGLEVQVTNSTYYHEAAGQVCRAVDSNGIWYSLYESEMAELHSQDIGFRELQKQLHKDSFDKGWWHTPEGEDLRKHPFTFPTKAMLIVTEVAEAIEGDRKDVMDDHLPQYSMRAVELADAQIRLMDLAEAYGIDLLEVILAKQAYNRQREDHKPENRAKKNGKKY